MPLKINDTEIHSLYIDGQPFDALKIDGVGYYGKKFNVINESGENDIGASVKIYREYSPYQNALLGYSEQNIYYGDVIRIEVTADSGYAFPDFYLDINDGNGLVYQDYLSPTISVNNDIKYKVKAYRVVDGYASILTDYIESVFATFIEVDKVNSNDKILISCLAYFMVLSDGKEDSHMKVFIKEPLPAQLDYMGARFVIDADKGGLSVKGIISKYEAKNQPTVTYIPSKIVLTEVWKKV